MKWHTRILLPLFVLCFGFTGLHAQKQAPAKGKGYQFRVKVDDYKNDTLILGYRLGTKTYVKDTVTTRNAQGEWVFKGDEALEGGLYLILLKPDNIYFEFLVPNEAEQNLVIYTKPDGKDLIKNLKIQGSPDNTLFLDYLAFINTQRKKAETIGKEKAELDKEGKTDKAAEKQTELEQLNNSVIEYQNNLLTKHPKTLAAQLIRGSQQPEVPKEIQDQGQEPAYRYFKAHYFDGFDWSDERLIRTPVLEEKVEFYLDKLILQIPDSIIVGVDDILTWVEKAGNREVYKYLAAHLLNKYAASKVICMDAVYVHIGKKYYCGAKKPEWVEAEQLEKICQNVQELDPVLCGRQAPPIQLRNINDGQPVSLYNVKAKFTVVYFWDPACGNCSKATDALIPIYAKYKDKGVTFLGICSKSWNELDQCKDKMKDKKMDWINLSDEAYPLAYVKKYYDIKMNPYIYLLDENKKIIFKRLDPQQVDEILNRELNEAKHNIDGKSNVINKQDVEHERKHKVQSSTSQDNQSSAKLNYLPNDFVNSYKIGQYKILIVAIDSALDSGVSLHGAKQYADNFFTIFSEKYTTEDNIEILLNPDKNTFFKTITKYQNECDTNDNFVLIFLGQTAFDDKKRYWLFSDATDEHRGNWLDNLTLVYELAAIPSQQILIITQDAFQSDLLEKDDNIRPINTWQEAVHVHHTKGMRVLTSGSQEGRENWDFEKDLLRNLVSNNFVICDKSMSLNGTVRSVKNKEKSNGGRFVWKVK